MQRFLIRRLRFACHNVTSDWRNRCPNKVCIYATIGNKVLTPLPLKRKPILESSFFPKWKFWSMHICLFSTVARCNCCRTKLEHFNFHVTAGWLLQFHYRRMSQRLGRFGLQKETTVENVWHDSGESQHQNLPGMSKNVQSLQLQQRWDSEYNLLPNFVRNFTRWKVTSQYESC